jgi:hypothetical protein
MDREERSDAEQPRDEWSAAHKMGFFLLVGCLPVIPTAAVLVGDRQELVIPVTLVAILVTAVMAISGAFLMGRK